MFKSRRKVYLSPRLARTIGRRTEDTKTKVAKTAAVIFISGFLFFTISGLQKNNVLPESMTYASMSDGEVLGAQSSNIAVYEVQGGDTLISISQKFNVYWSTIVEENELQVPYSLTPGQKLRIPLPRK